MAKIFLIFLALGFSFAVKVAKKDDDQRVLLKDVAKATHIKRSVDTKVIEKDIKKRATASHVSHVNDSTAVRTNEKTGIHYTDLVKSFDEESKIDDCNKELKSKRYAVMDLAEILTSKVTSKLSGLTDGTIDGETQFTPESTFAVNHCDKLFSFDNLKSKGYYVDDDKLRFPGDRALKLVYNYAQMHKYVTGITSKLPQIIVDVDGKDSRSLIGDTSYQSEAITMSASKRSFTKLKGLTCKEGTHNLMDMLVTFGVDDTRTSLFPEGTSENIRSYFPKRYSSFEYCSDSKGNNLVLYVKFDDNKFIYCKNDLVYSRCAVLGYFDSFLSAPKLVGNNGATMDELKKKFSCFIRAEKVIFQSSKREIDGELIFPGSDDFNAVLNNNNSPRPDEMDDANIFAGSAFRYLNKDWPEAGKDVRVFIYPRDGHYIFTFPDLEDYSVSKIIELLYTKCQPEGTASANEVGITKWLETNQNKISVEYIKIGDGYEGSDKYKMSIILKKRNTNESYQLIPGLSFTRIDKSSILLTIDASGKLNLKKNENYEAFKHDTNELGVEETDEMLGSKFEYEVKENQMVFTIHSPSNRDAIVGLRQTSPHSGWFEADGYGYLTPFESLNHFPLTSEDFLTLKVPLENNAVQYEFQSEAQINKIDPNGAKEDETNGDPIDDLKFLMMIRPTSNMNQLSNDTDIIQDTLSCVYTETGGKISDFINAVHEKPFFSRDWIEYGGIGITFSPTVHSTTQALCSGNNYKDTVDLKTTYLEIKDIEINSGFTDKKSVKTLPASFEIQMLVTLRAFADDKWENILHLTTDDDYCKGCRLPAVFVTKTKPKRFYICQTMNGKEQECLLTSSIENLRNKIINLTIIQTQISIYDYSFQVYVNDTRLAEELVNIHPQSYGDITLYIGNSWTRDDYAIPDGVIHSLKISGGKIVESHQVFEALMPNSNQNNYYVHQIPDNLGSEYMVTFELKLSNISAEKPLFQIADSNSLIYIDLTEGDNVEMCILDICKQKKNTYNWEGMRISQQKVGNQYVLTAMYGELLLLRQSDDPVVQIALKNIFFNDPSERRNLKITAYPTKVGVNIKNLIFNCDNTEENSEEKSEEKSDKVKNQKSCLLLTGGKPVDDMPKATTEFKVHLMGWMSQNEMQLSGIAETDELKIAGDKLKLIKKKDKPIWVEITEDSLTFIGMIRFKGKKNQKTSYLGTLQLTGELVTLEIKSFHAFYIRENPTIAIAFDNHIYLRFNEDGSVKNEITMNPEMCFGDPYKSEIWSGKEGLSQIEFNLKNPADSNYYACMVARSAPIENLLLGVGYTGPPSYFSFLDRAYIDELCWANYRNLKNVKELGKEFEAGFSYRGILSTSFGTDESYQVSTTGTQDKICLTMPILRWKNWEKTEPRLSRQTNRRYELPMPNFKREVVPDKYDKYIEKREAAVPDNYEGYIKEGRKLKIREIEEEKQGMIDPVETTINDVQEVEPVIVNDHICTPTKKLGKGIEGRNTVHKSQELAVGFKTFDFKNCVHLCYRSILGDPRHNGVRFEKGSNKCSCLYDVYYVDKSKDDDDDSISCTLKGYSNYPVEMFGFKDEISGPTLCYNLGMELTETFLSGNLKTFAFEEKGVIFRAKEISSDNMLWMTKFEYQKDSIKMFNGELIGKAKLTLKDREGLIPVNPLGMQMQITLDMKLEKKKKKKLISHLKKQIRTHKKIFSNRVNDFTERIEDAKEKKKNLGTISEKRGLSRSFQINSMERARAIKSFKRDCPYECGYAKIPGWTIQDTCSTKNNQGSMSCLKYRNDANIASNVGCIANCEAERARSYVDAKELDKRSSDVAEKKAAIKRCKRIIQKFIDETESYLDDAVDWLNLVVKLEKIRNNVAKNVKINEIHLHVEDHLNLLHQSLRCHNVSISYQMPGDQDNKTEYRSICFDGLYEDLAISLQKDYKQAILSQLRSDKIKTFEDLMDQRAIFEQYKFKNKNKKRITESRVKEFFKMERKVQKCVEGVTNNENLRERSTLMRGLAHVNWNEFYDYEKNTVEAFQDMSPWEVAKRRNVIEEFSKLGKKLSQKNLTTPTDDGPCMARKRTLDDYTNIASYIQKWTEEHKKAKREINLMDIENNNLKFHFWNLSRDVKNYTDDDVALMNYWQSQSKNGMKEWFQRESEMLDTYNKESLPLIKKQLNYMYTNDQHKTLREFFDSQSSLEKKFVQRQHIANSSVNTFTDLGKSLFEILDKGKTLEEIAVPIEDVLRHTDQLQKRSTPC